MRSTGRGVAGPHGTLPAENGRGWIRQRWADSCPLDFAQAVQGYTRWPAYLIADCWRPHRKGRHV